MIALTIRLSKVKYGLSVRVRKFKLQWQSSVKENSSKK